MRLAIALALGLAIGANCPASVAAEPPAAKPQADARVAAALKELNYQYELTPDQDFKLVFETGGDKRSQLVFINSNTETYDKAEIREIWSPSIEVDDPIDGALAQRLLKANDTYKLGGWRLWPADKDGGKHGFYVVFAAQVDANAPATMISAALAMVSQTADDLEKEIAKVDER